MKIFDLQCSSGHRFEGWFASTDDYAAQRSKGLLGCPACGGLEIERIPSVTRFNTGATAPSPGEEKREDNPAQAAALARQLYERLVDHVLSHSEDVGAAFPEEARRMHYEETPPRPIRGEASPEEHEALVEEGIPVARLPIPAKRRWN